MPSKTLNPLTDTPTSRTQITKSFMLAYIKAKGTPTDRKWFKSFCAKEENQKPFKSNLDGVERMDIDLAKLRKAFCERFFPNLLPQKKMKKSFLDMVDEL